MQDEATCFQTTHSMVHANDTGEPWPVHLISQLWIRQKHTRQTRGPVFTRESRAMEVT